MSYLCSELLFHDNKERGGLVRFFGLDLTSHERTELPVKRMKDGGTSLPERGRLWWVGSCTWYMATLATDEITPLGRKALHRVETEWGRQFQRVKKMINQLHVTHQKVAETIDIVEEWTELFKAGYV